MLTVPLGAPLTLSEGVEGERSPLTSPFWSFAMKNGARNALQGVVVSAAPGAAVVLRIAESVEIVDIVTRQRIDD